MAKVIEFYVPTIFRKPVERVLAAAKCKGDRIFHPNNEIRLNSKADPRRIAGPLRRSMPAVAGTTLRRRRSRPSPAPIVTVGSDPFPADFGCIAINSPV
jgi:hypothetical protein